MNRRRLVANLSASTLWLLGGCLGLPFSGATSDVPDCPSFYEEVSGTVCDPGNEKIGIDVTTAENTRSASIVLTNTSNGSGSLNPSGWKLFLRRQNGWRDLSPEFVWKGAFSLPPGKSYEYAFRPAANDEDSNRYSTVVTDVTLTEGTYAFATLFRWEEMDSSEELEVLTTFEM